jgi:hypothetical protein
MGVIRLDSAHRCRRLDIFSVPVCGRSLSRVVLTVHACVGGAVWLFAALFDGLGLLQPIDATLGQTGTLGVCFD